MHDHTYTIVPATATFAAVAAAAATINKFSVLQEVLELTNNSEWRASIRISGCEQKRALAQTHKAPYNDGIHQILYW